MVDWVLPEIQDQLNPYAETVKKPLILPASCPKQSDAECFKVVQFIRVLPRSSGSLNVYQWLVALDANSASLQPIEPNSRNLLLIKEARRAREAGFDADLRLRRELGSRLGYPVP